MWYNIFMNSEHHSLYKYRKWPLFLPAYFLFALIYLSVFYSWSDLSYRDLAETMVMAIFIVNAPLLTYFYLRVIKINKYQKLGLALLYAYLLSTLVIFLLMLTYLHGWEWFGAIAFLFFLLFYYLFFWILSWIIFKIKKYG